MNNFYEDVDHAYFDLIDSVLHYGEEKPDRTGTGTISFFGPQFTVDLSHSFPILTTKKVWFKGVVGELLWFLKGKTNVEWLQERGIHIWDEWANEDGELGPVYGQLWRNYDQGGLNGYAHHRFDGGVDQIQEVIHSIKNRPHSRRHIISTWDPPYLTEQQLPPCHGLIIQFYVQGSEISCKMYQRSADVGLGIPFNIASYALLTEIIGKETGYDPLNLTVTLGDAHIYKNHIDKLKEQRDRTPLEKPSHVRIDGDKPFDKYEIEDFSLPEYNHHEPIDLEVAV